MTAAKGIRPWRGGTFRSETLAGKESTLAGMEPIDDDGTADRDGLDALARRTQTVFEAVHQRVFLGDPVANPRLAVEVLGAATAHDTPVLVLITPWTLNGLAFPPDGELPATLEVIGRPRQVFSAELEGVGPFRSVNLVSDVSRLARPEEARKLARSFAEPFRAAVERARRPID